jgi:hypothetical protein
MTSTATDIAKLLGQPLTESVTVSGIGGLTGTLTATVYGPVQIAPGGNAPVRTAPTGRRQTTDNSCSTITYRWWTSTPTREHSFTVPVTGTGGLTVPVSATSFVPSTTGCYAWGDVLTLSTGTTLTTEPQAPSDETYVVDPELHVTARFPVEARGLTDAGYVTVTSGADGDFADMPLLSIQTEFYGPVPVPATGSCDAVSTAQYLATDTISRSHGTFTPTFTGNGWIAQSTTVTVPGCYSWGGTLSIPDSDVTVQGLPGTPKSDTRITLPAVVAQAPADVAVGRPFTNSVTVSGVTTSYWDVTSTLYGPTAVPTGGCGEVPGSQYLNHPLAQFVYGDTGSSQVGFGNKTINVSGPAATGGGCYAWSETLDIALLPQDPTVTPTGSLRHTLSTVLVTGEQTLVPCPMVARITPASGPAKGGTTVTITGNNLSGTTGVDFGSTPGTGLKVTSGTAVTVTAPAGTGTVNVTAISPNGTSTVSAADEFTYIPPPTVTKVTPVSGPTKGGTTVTITGTDFTGATAVDFGSASATAVRVVAPTVIAATSPPGTGTVNVTVTTPSGTSAVSAADDFTYAPAPTVTRLTPASGPAKGGNTVTITGTGFTGATTVDFGSTAATGVTVTNAKKITATAPPGTGTVNVTVTAPGGTSATSSANAYTYTKASSCLIGFPVTIETMFGSFVLCLL